jgi:hypothetical protein
MWGGRGKYLILTHLSIHHSLFPAAEKGAFYFLVAVARFLSRCGFFYVRRQTTTPCNTVETQPPHGGNLTKAFGTLPPFGGRLTKAFGTLPLPGERLIKAFVTLPLNGGRLTKAVGSLPPDFRLSTGVSTGYFSHVKLYKTNVS